MEIILSANEKGGCGKSTTVLLLASCLTALGYRVLAIDLDPSGNLSQATLPAIPDTVLYDVLTQNSDLYDTIVKGAAYDILPTKRSVSNPGKAGKISFGKPLPKENKSLSSFFTDTLRELDGWEDYLYSMVTSTGLEEHYDFVFLDSPPSDGAIITGCIRAATSVIIPCEPAMASLDGLKMFVDSVLVANPDIQLDGLVLSKVKENDRKTRENSLRTILDYADCCGMYVYKTRIRNSSAIETCMNEVRPLLDYISLGNGVYDAMNFALEFLAQKGLSPKEPFPGVVKDENGNYIYRKTGSKFYTPCENEDGTKGVNVLTFHMGLLEDEAFLQTIGRTAFFHRESVEKRNAGN